MVGFVVCWVELQDGRAVLVFGKLCTATAGGGGRGGRGLSPAARWSKEKSVELGESDGRQVGRQPANRSVNTQSEPDCQFCRTGSE
jgi:hypothetical protein